MPVKGLSEQTRVTRLGKIRLGEQIPVIENGQPKIGRDGEPVTRPVNREYFIVPEELRAEYGEQPTEIKIVFLSDEEEEIVSQYYRSYNKSHGRICIGDGDTADALLDADVLRQRGGDLTPNTPDIWAHGKTRGREATTNVVRQSIECRGAGIDGRPPCPLYAQKDCSVKMFMQAAVVGAPGLGVYQIDTASVINIQRINGAIRMVKLMTGGRVAGVRFVLRREQVEVAPPPSMRKTKQWVVTMMVDPELNAGRLLTAAKSSPVYALLGAAMPPPDETDAIEGAIDGEYTAQDDEHGATQERGKRTESPARPATAEQSAAPATPPDTQRALLARKYTEAGQTLGARDWNTLRARLRREYQGVWRGDDPATDVMDDAAVARMLADLRKALGEPDETDTEPHQHDPQYTEDGKQMFCRVCEVELDPETCEPFAQPAEQPAMALG